MVPATPKRSPLFPLVLSYAAMMALAIAINLLPVFLTTLSDELGGLTKEQEGRISAVTFIGLVLAILVTGRLADSFGSKRFAVLGNLCLSAGLLLLSLAHSYNVILLACLIMGAGAGTLDMILSPIVSALQPHRRTVAMNLLRLATAAACPALMILALLGLRQYSPTARSPAPAPLCPT
jgi:MFS family permease